MSNPTSNFGWQMPTATDLVTDLPADFEVFGQAVDSSMADLKGGTTGQILSKASATDMDFTWITNDVGDITAVTATTPLTGGGTTGAITVGIQDASTTQKGSVQLSDSTSTTSSVLASTPTATKSAYDLAAAAIPKSTFTTSGDLIQATGSGTFARLGTGTNGQYLTTNGTTNSWATPATGGMTLLSTTTLSGASTTISSISGSYTNLQIFIYGMTNNTAQGQFKLTFNALGNNNNYTIVQFTNNGTLATQINQNDAIYFTYASDNISRNYANNAFSLTVNNYASSAAMKSYAINGYYQGNSWNQGVNGGGGFNITSAINQIVLSNTGGTFSAGTCLIYGVK